MNLNHILIAKLILIVDWHLLNISLALWNLDTQKFALRLWLYPLPITEHSSCALILCPLLKTSFAIWFYTHCWGSVMQFETASIAEDSINILICWRVFRTSEYVLIAEDQIGFMLWFKALHWRTVLMSIECTLTVKLICSNVHKSKWPRKVGSRPEAGLELDVTEN